MSDKTLRLTIDTQTVPLTETLAAAAQAVPVSVLTHRALSDLASEVGGYEAAYRWLSDLAARIGKPIAANVPTGPDSSTTVWLAPPSWTQERLMGWVAGHREEVEALFGPSTVRPE